MDKIYIVFLGWDRYEEPRIYRICSDSKRAKRLCLNLMRQFRIDTDNNIQKLKEFDFDLAHSNPAYLKKRLFLGTPSAEAFVEAAAYMVDNKKARTL